MKGYIDWIVLRTILIVYVLCMSLILVVIDLPFVYSVVIRDQKLLEHSVTEIIYKQYHHVFSVLHVVTLCCLL